MTRTAKEQILVLVRLGELVKTRPSVLREPDHPQIMQPAGLLNDDLIYRSRVTLSCDGRQMEGLSVAYNEWSA